MAMDVRATGLSPKINADPKSPSAEQTFFVSGILEQENENDVMVAVLNKAANYLRIAVPNGDGLLPLVILVNVWKSGVTDLRFIGSGVAEATVVYRPLEAATAVSSGGREPKHDPGTDGSDSSDIIGPEWSFDTQGGTRHITQSLETRYKGATGGVTAPDLRRIIGLSRDKVEGCDVVSSDLKFSCTYKQCKFTFTYLRNLVKLTATTNTKNLLTFAPGEVLFLGAAGHYTDGDGWVIQYFFSIRANEVVTGTGSSQGIELIPAGENAGVFSTVKDGHDYVWFSYEDGVISGFTIQKPVAAYVERVYKRDTEAAGVDLRYLWSAA
jgi:hypothetical protein